MSHPSSSPTPKRPERFGRYVLLDRIDVGGMAEVFRGRMIGVEGFERMIALKRILPGIASDPDFVDMFVEEAKLAETIKHANVAKVEELGKFDGSYFIAMEYISGVSLRKLWDRARSRGRLLPFSMSCYILQNVCEGLDAAHRKKNELTGDDAGLIHRDVSPQNVLVSYEGDIKVIDFGIAKAANKVSKTQAGVLKGKFAYMSPEQVAGIELDSRSDIFACGVILYELVVGDRLFQSESDFSTLERVRKVDVPPPREINESVSPQIEAIIMKALAKDKNDRYRWASDMADDLQRYLYDSKQPFSRQDLQQYMQIHFADDIEEERSRLSTYNSLGDDLLDDGMPTVAMGPPPDVVERLQSSLSNLKAGENSEKRVVLPAFEKVKDTDLSVSPYRPLASTQVNFQGPSTPPVDMPPRSPNDSREKDAARPPLFVDVNKQKATPNMDTATSADADSRVQRAASVVGFMDVPTAQFSPESSPPHRPRLPTWAALLIGVLATLLMVLIGGVILLQGNIGAKYGGLSVKFEPVDAELLLDDRLIANGSPVSLDNLDPGMYVVKVRRVGYEDAIRPITIVEGKKELMFIELNALERSGILKVFTRPEGLEIWLDGAPSEQKSPAEFRKLPIGPHEIEIYRADGSLVRRIKAHLDAGKEEVIDLQVDELPPLLQVVSKPSGAQVFIDGALRGNTPINLEDLEAGTVNVEVKSTRCEPFKLKKRLDPGAVSIINAELNCRRRRR